MGNVDRMIEERWEYEEAKASGGTSLSFARWREQRERQAEWFTTPPEGQLLCFGFTQLPTASKRLRDYAHEVRRTSLKRAEIGEYVGGYFVPEVVILFEPDQDHRHFGLRLIDPDGEPYVGEHSALFTEGDIALIEAESRRYRWPGEVLIQMSELEGQIADHQVLAEARRRDLLFTATTPEGKVQHVLVRRDPASETGDETSAGKFVSYVPTDAGWLKGEPSGKLAFACGHHLAEAGGATVFVHEGCKTPHILYSEIQKVRRGDPSPLLDGHPFLAEILDGIHVGYLGGAGQPQRPDWDVLRKVRPERIVIVPDNDDVGRSAVGYISRALSGIEASWVQFTEEFGDKFDMADQLPSELFVESDGRRVYRADAPRLQDLVHGATWMTREIGQTEGRNPKPIYGLVPGVENSWLFAQDMCRWYDARNPGRKGVEDKTLNSILRRFSHIKDTVALLTRSAAKDVRGITYRPGEKPGIMTEDGEPKLNRYVAPRYSIAGPGADVSLWLQFMEHLVPEEEDRREVMRWVATLVAKPRVRMKYAVLLQSIMTGTGKSTLASICGLLVGMHNSSAPSSSLLVKSDFNGFLENKRLVVVHEIYEGTSWTAANRVKSLITEDIIEINTKHQPTYMARNLAHFICCSNNAKALQMESSDRRWLIPQVTEEKLPRDLALRLYEWLEGPGIPSIARWAQDFGDYVRDGAEAPMTERKKEQIEESLSKEKKLAIAIAREMAAAEKPLVIGVAEVLKAAKAKWGDVEVRSGPAEIAQAMCSVDGIVQHGPKRLRHAGGSPTQSIRNKIFDRNPSLAINDHLVNLEILMANFDPM